MLMLLHRSNLCRIIGVYVDFDRLITQFNEFMFDELFMSTFDFCSNWLINCQFWSKFHESNFLNSWRRSKNCNLFDDSFNSMIFNFVLRFEFRNNHFLVPGCSWNSSIKVSEHIWLILWICFWSFLDFPCSWMVSRYSYGFPEIFNHGLNLLRL